MINIQALLLFIIGFGLIFLFGYKLSKFFLPKADFVENVSLGFILSTGIFTFLWFLLNCLGIPFNLISGLLMLSLLNILLFLADKIFIKSKTKKNDFHMQYFKDLSSFEKLLLILILFFMFSALLQTIYWPVRYWDSLVLYDFRAKIFAQSGFMFDAIKRGYFFGYPLLTSLMHTWTYVIGIKNPSFYYALIYVFFIIVFGVNVSKFKIGRPLTLLMMALVSVSPRLFDHTQWAYTNLPYSIYVILGSIYLYWGIKKKDVGSFVVSAVLIGLSTWTRTAEPFWLSSLAVAVLFSLTIKKWFWPIIYSVILASIMMPWRIYQSSFGGEVVINIVNQVVETSASVIVGTSPSVVGRTLVFVLDNVISPYLGYFVLFLAVFLIKLLIKSRDWIFFFMILLELGMIFAGTLVFAKYVPYWFEIPDSLSRMVMFLPAMVLFFTAELLSELKKI